jgi:hypothetical protein
MSYWPPGLTWGLVLTGMTLATLPATVWRLRAGARP